MSKIFLLLTMAFSSFDVLYGQSGFGLMKLNTQPIADLPQSDIFESKNDPSRAVLDHRFNIMGYKPVKYDGYQVISSYQSSSNLDIVYFIDKDGNTVRRIWASTAPHNYYPRQANYDSMNPYGSPDVTSLLINAVLGTIFDRGIGLR